MMSVNSLPSRIDHACKAYARRWRLNRSVNLALLAMFPLGVAAGVWAGTTSAATHLSESTREALFFAPALLTLTAALATGRAAWRHARRGLARPLHRAALLNVLDLRARSGDALLIASSLTAAESTHPFYTSLLARADDVLTASNPAALAPPVSPPHVKRACVGLAACFAFLLPTDPAATIPVHESAIDRSAAATHANAPDLPRIDFFSHELSAEAVPATATFAWQVANPSRLTSLTLLGVRDGRAVIRANLDTKSLRRPEPLLEPGHYRFTLSATNDTGVALAETSFDLSATTPNVEQSPTPGVSSTQVRNNSGNGGKNENPESNEQETPNPDEKPDNGDSDNPDQNKPEPPKDMKRNPLSVDALVGDGELDEKLLRLFQLTSAEMGVRDGDAMTDAIRKRLRTQALSELEQKREAALARPDLTERERAVILRYTESLSALLRAAAKGD